MKATVTLAAVGMLLSAAGFAQAASQPSAPQPSADDRSAQPAHGTAASPTGGVEDQMRSDLEKAGFTDVNIVPDSFLIHARDRSGKPVTMFVGPHAMGAIAGADGTGASPAPGGSAAGEASGPDVIRQ